MDIYQQDHEEDLQPWEDMPVREDATETNQETATMTNTQTTFPTNAQFEAFFSQLGQYPRNNVLERLVQNLLSEAARAEEFADRIAFGDDVMHTLPPIQLDEAGNLVGAVDQFERPGPDSVNGERTLSEAQYALMTSLQEDVAGCMEMAAQLVAVYEAINGEKPAYGVYKTEAGTFVRITDVQQALKREYMRAHAQWLKRASANVPEGFDKAGAEILRQEAAQRRQNALGAF